MLTPTTPVAAPAYVSINIANVLLDHSGAAGAGLITFTLEQTDASGVVSTSKRTMTPAAFLAAVNGQAGSLKAKLFAALQTADPSLAGSVT